MAATAPPSTSSTAQTGSSPSGTGHTSGSLYVGDLRSDVTEAILFEMFNPVGPVASIRVCRDASTRVSLGYAYVNFHNVVDAERALDTLNFTPIKNQPCRIMWSHRDPSMRKTSTSNIFIKNLDSNIDNKSLYDTFSAYGNILSCKVALDSNMESKGYAFVHFETEKAALTAIEAVNGMMLGGKKVYAAKFERSADRLGGPLKFTNVYVKFIPTEWDEAKFKETFVQFGEITSTYMPTDKEGKHKGFACVNYKTFEEAQQAKEQGNKIDIGDDKTLFVDRFQKKRERQSLLNKRMEQARREKSMQSKNSNLYVKNLDDDVESAKLREMFEEFGEITSAVVMVDQKGVSRGFGFVCFKNPDDAAKALSEMNGKLVGQKPIYVNRAQSKEERRAQLEAQFQANMMGRMQAMTPMFYGPPGQVMGQANVMYPQPQMMARRYQTQPMRHGGYPGYPQARPGAMRGGGRPGAMPNAASRQQPKQRYQPPPPRPHTQPVAPAPMSAPAPQQGLSLQSLANMPSDVQKQQIGEKLFPLVQAQQPDLAGKITGMLLEMEVSEVLGLLDSPQELTAKVTEAMEVLQTN